MEEHTENPWKARKAILAFLYDRAGEEDPDCKYKDPMATVRAGAHYPEISIHTGLSLEVIGEVALDLVRENRADWDNVWNDDGKGVWLQITATGIRYSEEEAIVDAQQAEQRKKPWLAILRHADALRHRHGKHHIVDLWDLLKAGGGDGHARRALAILVDEDEFIERAPGAAYDFRITTSGREYLARIAEEEQQREQLIARFKQIEDLDAQPRGIALQGLIADAIRLQGYDCYEDEGGLGEQIDLIVPVGLMSFVCEAKWLKEAVQGAVVDQMVGRMSRRPSFFAGVILSMSGFSVGARHNLSRNVGVRTVLLLGREEIVALIRGERRFEEIVGDQLRAFATGEAQR
jgi:Restriction endonuclease